MTDCTVFLSLSFSKGSPVAPIADAPSKVVDEDFACAAAGEDHAVVAMIQINIEPKTCVIAVCIACFRQSPKRGGKV